MRQAIAVILAFIAFAFAGTCWWEIINPIFNIAHHSAIHLGRYVVIVAMTGVFAWLAFWWSRKLFEDAHAARHA